jgi:precorrin-4/cobalt-precorrin-4 C11-methyltransferase
VITSKSVKKEKFQQDDDKNGKVVFMGAGPGDPELLTLKAYRTIKRAQVIIYAGSLVNPEVLAIHQEDAEIYNSAHMFLGEIIEIMVDATQKGKLVARIHTGDPSIYGAIAEQIKELKKFHVKYEIIPGVSSLFAAAAALETELTLPEVSQTVIITRPAGRTPVPEKESIKYLAQHEATMCIFLGVGMIQEVMNDLKVHYHPETPVAVVKRASWPDQEIIKGNIGDIALKVEKAEVKKTALILVGDAIGEGDFKPSKLYDRDFDHEYRNKEIK